MLTICPTPIGNLDDVTPRQRAALEGADIIACEDTRVTGKLLELLGVPRGDTKLLAFHDYSGEGRVNELVSRLSEGAEVVLVSDAGTPAVSDPGFTLVRAAVEAGVEIVSLPGPVAGVVGLVASGLPSDRFLFAGFPPPKSKARRDFLTDIVGPTVVLYESPNRLVALIEDAIAVLGEEHPGYVGRELTKLHEEHLHGTLAELRAELGARDRIRGECVVCVGPAEREDATGVALSDMVRALHDEGLAPKRIKAVVSQLLGVSKSDVYAALQAIKAEG